MAGQGGFLPSILSPPASSIASSSVATLPPTRGHPLKSGSSKESTFIRYLDDNILKVQRRYARRSSDGNDVEKRPEATGYKSFSEPSKDIESLIDLIWLSGTPSLQVPYLLSLALLITQYLPSFPPAPKATFRLLDKLDLAFASLLQGRHVETGEPLPGFEGGRAVSGTEKVRIKSLVDQTRLCVVNVIGVGSGAVAGAGHIDDTDDFETEDEMDVVDGDSDDDDVEEIDRREMGIARIYDRTVVELGDVLGGTPIGIITDD